MKRFALVAVLGTMLAACGPDFDHTDISGQQSKIGGAITKSQLTVPVGMIVKAHLAPYNDDHELMTVNVQVRDPDVVEAAPVVSVADFAFIGLRPGHTEIQILADGKVVLIIPTDVTEQGIVP